MSIVALFTIIYVGKSRKFTNPAGSPLSIGDWADKSAARSGGTRSRRVSAAPEAAPQEEN